MASSLPDRDALTSRQPPSTTLNHPRPIHRRKNRFTITGNAIITGGAGTLGLTACTTLLEHGLTGLLILDTNPETSSQEINSLRAKFPTSKILTAKADITDEDAIRTAFASAATSLGSIDILCCFAGIVGCADALTMPAAQFRQVLDVNTTGAFICAQAAARHMVEQGTGGAITLIASISGHRVNFPQPQVAYNVSKTGLLMMKSCLAAEWARYGIRTNSISPGYMDTILNEGDGLLGHRRVWAERNPFGRMGVPQEIMGALVLLCSREGGGYINGADIVVDGGGIVF